MPKNDLAVGEVGIIVRVEAVDRIPCYRVLGVIGSTLLFFAFYPRASPALAFSWIAIAVYLGLFDKTQQRIGTKYHIEVSGDSRVYYVEGFSKRDQIQVGSVVRRGTKGLRPWHGGQG